MIYRWIHLFRKQKALWLGVLENMAVPAAPFIDSVDGVLLKNFFLAFRFSYMEALHGADPETLPSQPCHPGGIT